MDKIRILIVEDFEVDAELLLYELQRANVSFVSARAHDRQSYEKGLEEFKPDIIISDFSLPQFTALEALEILGEHRGEIPFILVTGSQSEEVAVDCMRLGAFDYILKRSLSRLPSAVLNAIHLRDEKQNRVDAEISLRRSENNFRTLIETSADLMFVHSRNELLYVNQAVLTKLGYSLPGELLGNSPFQLIADAYHDAYDPERRATHTGEGLAEQIFLMRNGDPLNVEVHSTPIQFNDKPAMLVTARDLTERKSLQNQVILADRMSAVGVLAAGVAHEVNNPISYVGLNLHFVKTQLTNSHPLNTEALAEIHQVIDDALDGVERVTSIVRELKSFVHHDAETSLLDVHTVMNSALKIASSHFSGNTKVLKNFSEVPPVNGNSARLGQVFLNLLVNAAQSLDDTGHKQNEVRIRIGPEADGWVVISVEDTGSGMEPAVVNRIFNPFFTTKPVGVGTGLGLSVTQNIVLSMGGLVSVESQVGVGTTFHVKLPAG